MKFLIDTGANKNYISADRVNLEYCDVVKGVKVANIKGAHEITHSVSFDPFQIKKKLKFYVFKFHEFFDGLIGYESLRDLKAQLNISKNTLKVGRKEFKLKQKFLNDLKINTTEQEFQYLSLKTSKDGDFTITDERNFGKFSILPGIYRSLNGKATVAIQNHSKIPLEINMNQIDIRPDKCEIAEKPNIEFSQKHIDYRLRNEHMNDEEKKALEQVIRKNLEILYDENEKLTFTHKIKHKIRTTDNLPIHVKSYR